MLAGGARCQRYATVKHSIPFFCGGWMLLLRTYLHSAGLAKGFRGSATKDEPTILREPFVLEVPLPFTILPTGSFFHSLGTLRRTGIGLVTSQHGREHRAEASVC